MDNPSSRIDQRAQIFHEEHEFELINGGAFKAKVLIKFSGMLIDRMYEDGSGADRVGGGHDSKHSILDSPVKSRAHIL